MRLPRVAASAALAAVLTASALAAPRHVLLLREAAAAAKAGDPVTALAKLEAAAALRPDYPRVQLGLARAYAQAHRSSDALAALRRLVRLGVKVELPPADPLHTALQSDPDFAPLERQLRNGPPPVGEATAIVAVQVPAATGILEGCLFDPETGAWYFSDVRQRCIWRLGAGGPPRKFTSADDALDGVFKLALSPDRRTLWAATATVGAMEGPDAEDGKRTALVALDFATGRVRSRHAVPADGRKHLLGDFAIAADGSLLATDSFAPVIWRLAPGAAQPEIWLERDDFLSLQGIAFAADGATLYVADYANGIWRIDVATRRPSLLQAPANASFFGLDGLYRVGDALLAVQNGVEPQRILHLEPAPAGQPSPARILALGQPGMSDLSLGTIVDGRFHFIANSGWSLFDPAPATPPAPRRVVIYSLSLDP